MMGRTMSRLPVCWASLLAATSLVAAGSPVCANNTFTPPSVLGAEFGPILAVPVQKWKINGIYPETKLFPAEGMDICNVTLTYRHPGQGDTVLVQVLLPDEWNGRFAAAGGGGFAAGKLDGEPIAGVLALGYATAVTDSGHDNTIWSRAPWALKSPGNLNYPLLYNFASLAVHELSIIGKSVTTQYYGRPPEYSYFSGCSTGGRQGVTSAFSYPDDFDGIVAGAPALNLADLTPAGYWAPFVMNRMGAYPAKCEMDAINNASVAACDALDGLVDGIIADPDACKFDPQSLVGRTVQCPATSTAPASNVTVSAAAARVAAAVRDGPKGTDGKPLFVGAPHGTPFTGALAAANTNCSATPCTAVPFPMSVDWIALLVHRDPAYDVSGMTLAELEATFALSRRRLGPIIGADNPDLSGFRAGGRRKMISWHGLADECITARGSRLYYDRVLAADPAARDYYRHFEAPGVNHCAAAPGFGGGFYPLRALDALVRWVETGIPPDVLTGYRLPADAHIAADPPETRPVCMYPDVLKYGGGDPVLYGSFKCGPRSAGGGAGAIRLKDEL